MTHLQPLLHDLVTCVRAPTCVLSGADGQIRASGAQGAFHGDLRVLSTGVLTVDGREPDAVWSVLAGPSAARFLALARELGDAGPDPTVRVERHRTATASGLRERVAVVSAAAQTVHAVVTLRLGADLAPVQAVKAGHRPPLPVAPVPDGPAARWTGPDGLVVRAHAEQAKVEVDAAGRHACLSWDVTVAPRGRVELEWVLEVADPTAVMVAPAVAAPWRPVTVSADDARLPALLDRSVADLDALRLVLAGGGSDDGARADPATGGPGQFTGAGSPWYLTLFGRDSIWAARLALPLGTGLAEGTLAVLAARQGSRHDPGTAEEPGKVLHELRRAGATGAGDAQELPPVYYGTVDATPLWVLLLHDAWRWGLPDERVARFLPHLEAAMAWISGPGDADGDGFLEYVDASGTGLANQGWKDSADSVRFRDGRVAVGPVALVEVQGYAYEAARDAAALLAAFGRPGADRWLGWAEALAERFRSAFWVEDERGPYPAMALDGAKRPVDALTSNVGHLLGTGLLSASESAAVAQRLAAPDMDSGFGLRTMSTSAGGYSPLSYHCGSVWPHDTAVAALGLARDGHAAQAGALVEGLLRAAPALDDRLPELWSGDGRPDVGSPVPYPAACRPQAWSAAAGVAALQVLLGLRADVPAGRLELAPLPRSPAGAVEVSGLAVAGKPLAVSVDAAGRVTSVDAPAGVSVETR